MFLSNGIDIDAAWNDSIAWSSNGTKWNTIQKDGLTVRSHSAQRRSGALNQNSGRDISIIIEHQGKIVLNFKLPVQNRPTWTNNVAGSIVAVDEINTWLSVSGYATEANQSTQITIANDQLTELEAHTVQNDDIITELQNIVTTTGANNVVTSAGNTSTTPLADGVTFTGAAELTARTDVMVVVKTDQNGVLYVEFSPDGTNWDTSLSFQYNTGRINAPHIFETGNRYIRVRFENNSGSAQTFLRLYTYYGNTMSQLTAPINGTLAENYDATIVRPTDYFSEVAMGKRQGRSVVNKFGWNNAIVGNNTPEIVAAWSASFNPNTDIITTAQTLTVTYNSGTDGVGNTGATQLLVDYLDADFNLQQGVHVLGSTGTDTTSFSVLGINRVVVIGNGGTGWNENDITFTATTDGTTQAMIPAEASVTEQLIYHTPINHMLLTDWVWFNILKTSGGGTPRVNITGYSWSRVTQTRYDIFDGKLDTNTDSILETKPSQKFSVGGREVLYFVADSNVNNTAINGRFSGVLERVL